MAQLGTPLPQSGVEDRLDSWKEIAAYLRRDPRTVQRWERTEGLPVRRHLHEAQPSVYAYKTELDEWLAKRAPQPDDRGSDPPGSGDVALGSADPGPNGGLPEGTALEHPRSLRAWLVVGTKRRLAWAAMGGALLLVIAFVWVRNRPGSPGFGFHERDWVLLAGFENRTGEPLFEGTLQDALERELSNSSFVNVIPSARVEDVLRLMKKPPDTPVDAALGREICRRDGGIRALITGRAEKFGSAYVLSVRLVEPVRGHTLATAAEEASGHEQIWSVIRKLSNWVRMRLGEELRRIEKSNEQLEKVTTPSFRALQLFSRAVALGNRNEWAAAEQLLRQALVEDPEFASAHIWLACALKNQDRRHKELNAAAARAAELSETATERERYFILGTCDLLTGVNERTPALFETLLRLHPDDYWARNNLARVYSQSGRFKDAALEWVSLAELRPNDYRANFRAARALTAWGDPAGARRYMDRARLLTSPETARLFSGEDMWIRFFPVYEAWLREDPKGVLDELNRLTQTSDSLEAAQRDDFARSAGLSYLAVGRLKAAQEWFHKATNPDTVHRMSGLVSFFRGDEPGCGEHLARLSLDSAMAELCSGALLAQREDVTDPDKIVPHEWSQYRTVVSAELLLAQGQVSQAISLLQESIEKIRATWDFQISADALATAYEREGEQRKALEILEEASRERSQAYPTVPPYGALWLRIQARLAKLYESAGRGEEAEKVKTRLRRLLAYADADHPILEQLKH